MLWKVLSHGDSRKLPWALPAALLLGFVAPPLAAADFPPIPADHQALAELPWAPGAPAVVLFAKAQVQLKDWSTDVSSFMHVQQRIKILTEEGKRYGEVRIPHSRIRRLKDFQGRTVTADGKVVPLGADAVFEERTSRARKQFLTKAAFPAVEIGAIIDYSYTLRWDSLAHFEPWLFRNEIPTLLSEISFDKPNNMGVRSWGVNTGSQKFQTSTTNSPRGNLIKVWMENLPGVPNEPSSFPFIDLADRYMLIPTEVIMSGRPQRLFDDWKNTCDLFDDWFYAKPLRKAAQAKKKAKELTAGARTDKEKAAALYAFVRDQIQSEPSLWILVPEDSTADRVLEERRGWATEKALLLHAMLDAAKLSSRLVWASDHREGRIDLSLANPSWFDGLLVRVELDGQAVFLDPSDRRLGFGRLRAGNEGAQALQCDKKKPEALILPKTPHAGNLRNAALELTIDGEGRIGGTGRLRLEGHHAYAYLQWKDDPQQTIEAWEEWLEEEWEDFSFSKVHVDESLEVQKVEVTWTMTQREEAILGDEAELVPSRPLGPLVQPFALPPERRATPVQLAFTDRDQLSLSLTWPEDWQVALLPEAVSFQNSAGSLVAEVEADDERRLTYTRKLDITQAEHVGREAYGVLRNLFAKAAAHDAQSLLVAPR